MVAVVGSVAVEGVAVLVDIDYAGADRLAELGQREQQATDCEQQPAEMPVAEFG